MRHLNPLRRQWRFIWLGTVRPDGIRRPQSWTIIRTLRPCSSSTSIYPSPIAVIETTKAPNIPPTDHRDITKEQRLIDTSNYSPGSPLFHPHGAHIFNTLVAFLRAQYRSFGFEEVITPSIYKRSLWERSGHWDNYAADMYSVVGRGASGEKEDAELGEDEVFGLKPMNCPGHCLLFDSRKRSHKDLPIRYADFSALHRNETSGSLSGLTRLRRFHQDDGHIFCRPSQVSQEVSATLEFVAMVYQTFKLPPFKLVLSTRPHDHYIGTISEWDRAEAALEKALNASGREWSLNEGDGAFYGPKIDIILKDSDGKDHQTATIQLDFQLPQRFNLHYNAPAPEVERKGETTTDKNLLNQNGHVTPVIIHRAILGSLERFMALLIEHYKGNWPFWLSPRQATVLSVGRDEASKDYARDVALRLSGVKKGVRRGQKVQGSAHEAVRAPQTLESAFFRVDVNLDDKPLAKKQLSVGFSNILVVVRPDVWRQDAVEVDFSRQPNQDGLDVILKEILSEEEHRAFRETPKAVLLSPDKLHQVFLELSHNFE